MAKKWPANMKEYSLLFGSFTGTTIFLEGGLAAMTAGGGITLATVLAMLHSQRKQKRERREEIFEATWSELEPQLQEKKFTQEQLNLTRNEMREALKLPKER